MAFLNQKAVLPFFVLGVGVAGVAAPVGMVTNLAKFWLQRNVPKHPLLGEIYAVSLWDYCINLTMQLGIYPGLCVAGWLHWRAAHGGSAADTGDWAVGGWLGTPRLYGAGTDLLLVRASLYVFAANLVRRPPHGPATARR